MKRTILHADANSFYASVECVKNPSLWDKPVAVCGDPEARHGIVLTKNQVAKKFGIQTGEAIWQAKQKCPELLVLAPDYDMYVDFSRKMREIYEDYTDCVEAFGLDENWLDISSPRADCLYGERVANEIRMRVKDELGLTVSIGVSFNKVFAKLGSDYKKPDAVTVISEDNFKSIVWPLPVSDLIYVGPRTARKLIDIGILTIGQLANASLDMLQERFGVNGIMLKAFAMGLDDSRVMRVDETEAIKSIGNSTTPPHDIDTLKQAKCIIYLLCESIAARMREHGFKAKCVSLTIRDVRLACCGCQLTLERPSGLSGEIARAAYAMFVSRYESRLPLRSMGVACSALSPANAPEQTDIFGVSERRLKQERLESALDSLRGRFGHQIVKRGIVMLDSAYSDLNPKEEQTIHPTAFLKDDTVRYGRPEETKRRTSLA